MKLAAIQFRPTKGHWPASADALCALIQQAATEGADLIVCPEMALTGYLFPDEHAAMAVAEVCTGPTFQRLSPLARDLGCYLVVGYPERTAPDPAATLLYNSALIIGPDGQLVGNYRKRLLYECDKTWAQPGDLPYPLIPTPLGVLTVGICMDLNDPRFTYFLRQEQPDLVAFCTNWIHQGYEILPYWHNRLYGVRSFFIAANTYGHEREGAEDHMNVHFLGRSAVLDRDGQVLALAPETGDAVLLTPPII